MRRNTRGISSTGEKKQNGERCEQATSLKLAEGLKQAGHPDGDAVLELVNDSLRQHPDPLTRSRFWVGDDFDGKHGAPRWRPLRRSAERAGGKGASMISSTRFIPERE